MSTALDLNQILPAFATPMRDSQVVFRQVMEAVARPGTRVDLGQLVEPPAGLAPAAAALALTVLDFETSFWLDPALRGTAAETWLRFHCGAPLTADPARAAFALVVDMAAAPALTAFNAGDAKYPDRSTTVILQLPALDGGQAVTLSGPGVKGEAVIAPAGLPTGFWAQVQDNNAKFQFGVDVLLLSGSMLIAVPRSTRVQIQGV